MIQELRQFVLQVTNPVYMGFIPATSGVTIQPYPGEMPNINLPYDTINFQIRTKQQTYTHAELVANQVYQKLQAFSVSNIINLYAKQTPFYLMTDEQRFVHFAQNFYLEYYNSNRA